ncbi:HNH endonuclease [Pseudomonas sp. ANT_J12]|uniref:HNH endonuclease signature motif containing protein n=1 Tax=Pseudomonas sp. ANT_J12 TaxID=2597351 RepID=UPI0011F20A98|nr:HNH endonuclease signature motif containing protein [Pseudomonas sp. ANT_J12]KAA0995497.1 HNH endonuclease [Pseudomonas sp. ANT_J12]
MPDMYSEQRTRLLREMIAYDPLTGLFTWKVDHCRRQAGDPAGSKKPDGYIYLKLLGQTYGAHRVAWMLVTGDWPVVAVDHRDGVRSNNEWENLRLATRAQNSANVPPRGASGLKGATFNKREQRWKAQICIRGKQTCLGTFHTAEQAHAAYIAAADRYQGQFAHHHSRRA